MRTKQKASGSNEDRGFSLVEVFIAIALLAVTAYLFASMSTYTKQASVSLKTISARDNAYFSIGNLAGDASALFYTLSRTDVEANACYRACLNGRTDAPQACRSGTPTGSMGTSICLAHGGTGTSIGTGVWHRFALLNPVSRRAVAGHESKAADALPVRYSRNGEICEGATLPNSMCPIVANAEVGFTCPELRGSCQQAASVIVRYRLSWTTDTSVRVEQASFKSLTGEMDTYRKFIMGDVGASLGSSETYLYTSTGTGTGSGSLNTNTQTCTTDTSTGTSTNSSIGAWVPFCV